MVAGNVNASPRSLAGVMISAHAVDRYIERWAPRLRGDPEAAHAELARMVAGARFVHVRHGGAEMWRTARPLSIRLIIDRDADRPVLATVYPPYAGKRADDITPTTEPKPCGPVFLDDGRRACRVCRTPLTNLRCQKSTCGDAACRREHNSALRRWRRRHEPGFREKVAAYQTARKERIAADPDAYAAWKANRKQKDQERNARRRDKERERAAADPVYAAELKARNATTFARWISKGDRREKVRTKNRERMRAHRAERMAQGHPFRQLTAPVSADTPPPRLPAETMRQLRSAPADDATMAALVRLLGGCLCCGAEPRAVINLSAPPGATRAAVDVCDLPETPWPDVMPACSDCAERWARSSTTWDDFMTTLPMGAPGVSESHRWACDRVTTGLVLLEADRLAHTRKDHDWERHPAEVWSARAPITGPYLPGVWREIRFAPEPHAMIPMEHTVALHGLLSSVLLSAYGHDRKKPAFSLIPWRGTRSGWSVYVDDAEAGRALSCEPTHGHLRGCPVGVGFGAQVVRPRTPRLPEPGRYRVRMTAMTPVVIRTSASSKTLLTGQPSSSNLLATLTSANFCARLRVSPDDVRGAVLLRLPGSGGELRTVRTGGHLGDKTGPVTGAVSGWVGEMVVEVNAPGLWLLRCAEVVGLGGRTAYGFGCVRLSSVERQDAPSPHVP